MSEHQTAASAATPDTPAKLLPAGVPLRDKLAVTVAEACAVIGIKPTRMYDLINSGAVRSKKIAGRRVILVESLVKLVDGDRAEIA